MGRACMLSVVTTDMMRFTNRLPVSESVPKISLRQITARRRRHCTVHFIELIPSKSINGSITSLCYAHPGPAATDPPSRA